MIVDKYNELSCEIMNRDLKADIRRNGWLRGCKRMVIWIKADKRRMGGRETTKRGRVMDRQINDWLRGCKSNGNTNGGGATEDGWCQQNATGESDDTSCYNGDHYLLVSAKEYVEKMCRMKRYLSN